MAAVGHEPAPKARNPHGPPSKEMTTMRSLTRALTHLRRPIDPDAILRQDTNREWQRLLSEASSPAERADIDAMFAAAIG